MNDSYLYVIIALMPIAAVMLTLQVNPYHALVIRGILGGISSLIYALLGAPDVALTEALVGTMLSITLYAVAVRSSLSMRLGVIEPDTISSEQGPPPSDLDPALLAGLRKALDKYHLRLELVPYPAYAALQTALLEKEVHSICIPSMYISAQGMPNPGVELLPPGNDQPSYHLQTRVQRLYDLMQTDLPTIVNLTYVNLMAGSSTEPLPVAVGTANSAPEAQP